MSSDLIPAIVKTVTVPLSPEKAFDHFTARIGEWWPLATHSVGGTSSGGVTCTVDGVVETIADGTTTTWAEVTCWEPPSRLTLSWHPGAAAGPHDTEVEVTFRGVGDGTEVRLEHRGWERAGGQRSEYGRGWDVVLSGFVASA